MEVNYLPILRYCNLASATLTLASIMESKIILKNLRIFIFDLLGCIDRIEVVPQ